MGYLDRNTSLPDGESYAPDARRVEEIASIIGDEPFHFAPSSTDRSAWNRVASSDYGRNLLEDAEAAATAEPISYFTNSLYLEGAETGDLATANRLRGEILNRLSLLPIAEGIDPTGRYLPRIEKDIQQLSSLKVWSTVNQEGAMDFYVGTDTFPDLVTFHYATNFVTADKILGERLSPVHQNAIREEVHNRIFAPIEERINSGKNLYWWFTVKHNWNSVCLASLLVCALYLKSSVTERAWYIAVVERFIRYSEHGFEKSGFYTEGVTYWGYGFGHYALASELVRRITVGKIDWMGDSLIEPTSRFGLRMEIQHGIYPTFADCARDRGPPKWLVHWMNNRIDPHREVRDESRRLDWLQGTRRNFSHILSMLLFGQFDPDRAYELPAPRSPREWFDDAQFLICRSTRGKSVQLAATFKGGHNGVNHNHNDLGTFTVMIDDQDMIVDPGGEEYTNRTFGPNRYDGDLLNSFGHPVPVVAGQMQVPGEESFARVIRTDFSGTADVVELDLTRAYRVGSLRSLKRTFAFNRTEIPFIAVTDEVLFSQPESFELSLITFAGWSVTEDGVVILRAPPGGGAIEIRFETDAPLEIGSDLIRESSTPTRLSISFAKPISNACVETLITVADSKYQ